MDSKFGQVDTKFGQISSQIEILRRKIMSIREEPKKPVEISPAKVQPNATLKHYKMPKFDGESLWDLYRRQFEVAPMARG